MNFRSRITNLLDELAKTDTGILFMVDELDGSLKEMAKLATTFNYAWLPSLFFSVKRISGQ